VDDGKVLDAAIIGSAQAVEHYEIARYGTLIAWAEELGHDNVIRLLNANLKEEKAADKKLNTIAEGTVNRRATGAGTARDKAARTGSVRAASHGLTTKRTGDARRKPRKTK
jgi:ferritin-like metal-binding protein YciE